MFEYIMEKIMSVVHYVIVSIFGFYGDGEWTYSKK